MTTMAEPTKTPITGTTLDYARDHAERFAAAMDSPFESWPTILHVVEGGEVTTVPFSTDGLGPRDRRTLIKDIASQLISASNVDSIALQLGTWVGHDGRVVGKEEGGREGLAIIVTSETTCDCWVADVVRHTEKTPTLVRWHRVDL